MMVMAPDGEQILALDVSLLTRIRQSSRFLDFSLGARLTRYSTILKFVFVVPSMVTHP
jgi:hypothetical protein